MLTTSCRYRTLLISAIFLNVSSEIGSVKHNTNSEESRDGKKHKISATRDTYISLCHLRFGRCHVTKPLFGNCNRMKLCNRKSPSEVQLKIIVCDDF